MTNRYSAPMSWRTLSIALVVVTVGRGQDLSSGPAAGTTLTKAVVYAPSGPRAGLEFDLAESIGTAPGAILFIHEITRNVAPMIRAFDRLGAELRILGLRSHSVFLAEDRTAAESQVKRTSASLRMHSPMVVSVDGVDGPGNYALNRRCTLTLVLVNDGKVIESKGYTDTGQNDVPAMRESITALTGPLPRDPGALRKAALEQLPADADALRKLAAELAVELHWAARLTRQNNAGLNQRMRNQPQNARARPNPNEPRRPLAGAVPTDETLVGLLRRFIRKTHSTEQVDEIYAEMEKHVGDSADLRKQTVEGFKRMLSVDYGNEHAQGLMKKYIDAHDKQ